MKPKLRRAPEGDRLKVAAEAEIEQEINRAKEELRATVAGLALAGAEKVLEASIDEKANRALVDKLSSAAVTEVNHGRIEHLSSPLRESGF